MRAIFAIDQLFVLQLLVEKAVEFLHRAVGDALAKLVDLDLEALQFFVDFRLFLRFFLISHGLFF